MAYPVLYDITYSYTGFQQAQGDNSFPGTQLDADLAGLQASIDGLAAFVEVVIRSDGRLANQSVDFDQLTTAVKAMIGSADDATALLAAMAADVAAASASATAAGTSATTAAGSATAAAGSATAAAGSATAASGSASTASTAATNSSTSASSASTSATAAATSATNAAATLAAAVTGPASAVDKTAARFNGATGKLAQGSVLAVADTTGSLSRTGNGGIPVQGTNTNDNAAAGYVGEEIRRAVASGSAIALTTGVAANINFVDLTAGDWIVGGNIVFLAGAGMISTEYHVCTDPLTATINSDESAHAFHTTFTTSQSAIIPVGAKRYSLAASTRIYMNCTQTFSGGTLSGYGTMWARRMR